VQSAYPALSVRAAAVANQGLGDASKQAAATSKTGLGSLQQPVGDGTLKCAQAVPIMCDATGLSISVGKDIGNGTVQEKDGQIRHSSDSLRMVWEGLDGERISPRHSYHRKRTDLTSRRQIRNGYGIQNSRDVLAAGSPSQQTQVKGLKTLQEKRLKQKKYAEEIAAAATQERQKVPDFFPSHSALPMNRPSENNWAFQTLYMPKTVSQYNPGNISKVIRKIDYQKERPTFGAHSASN